MSDAHFSYVPKIDRRSAMLWLGAAVTAGSLGPAGGVVSAYGQGRGESGGEGYGTDPNLVHPQKGPWPRILTKAQLQTAALLSDFVLPGANQAPSASEVGVPEFIDEWVSAPYPEQLIDRPLILQGLDGLAAKAQEDYGRTLWSLGEGPRRALLQKLTVTPPDPQLTSLQGFFRRFRSLTIGAYYTTKPGFADVGYLGNTPMSTYPGPSDEVKAALELQFRKLGLLGRRS